jgi:alcohol dehydrogenase class IV
MSTGNPLRLRKFLLPEIVYGDGAIELAGRNALAFGGAKVLLVSDPGVMEAGWTASVEASLKTAGMPYSIYSDVTPNPKDYEVMRGVDFYREENCNIIIAVGGGSPMDCAKGIGVMAGNPGHINDYEGVGMVRDPGPPMIFIPTTAGSSADVSQFAIITDTSRMTKIAIVSKMVIPDLALVDPATTVTMPPELTAETGMDALSHAFEAFVSNASSPLTDMAALSAVRLVRENLQGAHANPEDMNFRNNMMMASLMAGLAFSNASLGLVHSMAHALGGAVGLPHGECNAILLEKVVEFNYPSAAKKYDQLAQAMGIETGGHENEGMVRIITERLAQLRMDLGVTERLGALGVPESDLPELALKAFNDPCLATNPRAASPEDIEKLFRSIY